VNSGWPDSLIVAALLDSRNTGGEKAIELVQLRGYDAAAAYIARSIVKARQLRPPRSRGEAIASVDDIEAAAVEAAPTMSGTDLLVLLGHITIGRRVRSLNYGASVREVAELAGVGRTSVSEAQYRLVEAGWLVRFRRMGLSATTRWSLQLPGTPSQSRTALKGLGGCDHDCPDVILGSRAAIWRTGEFGGSALRIWLSLSYEPAAIQILGARLSLGSRTVRSYLHRLQIHGLAVESGGIWIPGDIPPQKVHLSISQSRRAIDERSRRRERHERERDEYEERRRQGRNRDWPTTGLL
jgi:hypothetical protein